MLRLCITCRIIRIPFYCGNNFWIMGEMGFTLFSPIDLCYVWIWSHLGKVYCQFHSAVFQQLQVYPYQFAAAHFYMFLGFGLIEKQIFSRAFLDSIYSQLHISFWVFYSNIYSGLWIDQAIYFRSIFEINKTSLSCIEE